MGRTGSLPWNTEYLRLRSYWESYWNIKRPRQDTARVHDAIANLYRVLSFLWSSFWYLLFEIQHQNHLVCKYNAACCVLDPYPQPALHRERELAAVAWKKQSSSRGNWDKEYVNLFLVVMVAQMQGFSWESPLHSVSLRLQFLFLQPQLSWKAMNTS